MLLYFYEIPMIVNSTERENCNINSDTFTEAWYVTYCHSLFTISYVNWKYDVTLSLFCRLSSCRRLPPQPQPKRTNLLLECKLLPGRTLLNLSCKGIDSNIYYTLRYLKIYPENIYIEVIQTKVFHTFKITNFSFILNSYTGWCGMWIQLGWHFIITIG